MKTEDKRRRSRFGWIEACLQYGGQFNTQDKACYVDVFSITESMASRDASEFERSMGELHGHEVVERIGRTLRYVARVGEPMPSSVFEMPDLRTWMSQRLGSRFRHVAAVERGDPSPAIVAAVIASIVEKKVVGVTYHSRQGSSQRDLSPHTVVDVAGRLHVRAYDHSKGQFGDFVLNRITACRVYDSKARHVAYCDPRSGDGNIGDVEWNAVSTVVVRHKDEYNKGVALDFGLGEDGTRSRKISRALVQYVVDQPSKGHESPVVCALQEL